jgi:hypothetical protein
MADEVTMPSPNIEVLARIGAEARYREIEAELAALVREFPDLRRTAATQVRANGVPPARASAAFRRRPKWSAEARKAVSVRMKKYWATWRNRKAR